MATRKQFEKFLSELPQYRMDDWGNFKSDTGEWRYKLGKSAVRFEHKLWSEATEYSKRSSMWVKRWSAYYKNIDFVDTDKGKKLKVLKYNR